MKFSFSTYKETNGEKLWLETKPFDQLGVERIAEIDPLDLMIYLRDSFKDVHDDIIQSKHSQDKIAANDFGQAAEYMNMAIGRFLDVGKG